MVQHLAAPAPGAPPAGMPGAAAAGPAPGALPAAVRAAAGAADAAAPAVESRSATAKLLESIPVKDR